jgi:hypothetical protein
VEFIPLVFVLHINIILLNQRSTKTAIKPIKMTTQKFKVLQTISGSIMIILLITYLYMDWKLGYRGLYYSLIKAIFQIFLALTWHFGMVNLKINQPEKYKPTLHKVLVGIWGVLGVIQIIDLFTKLF